MYKRFSVHFLAATLLSFFFNGFSHAATVLPAPFCALNKFDSKEQIKLNELPGKYIYVDFWASWCLPCKESFPFMNDLKKQFESQGLTIIGVSENTEVADAKKFLSANKADFVLALDIDGACAKSMNIQSMPSSFILNRSGEIVYEHEGFHPSDRETITRVVQELINKK